MTLKAIVGRGWVRALGLAGAAAVGYVFGATADTAGAQQPGGNPPADRRVVAYIYGNIPVTREELGEFLIARGGHEKLELLVNKRIIEIEAARRNLTVTGLEVESGLVDDLKGMNLSLADFEKKILPRYGKSLYEWGEDVIKPRILLGKMCRERIKVTEDDLRRAYENKYGERRQAKVICWSKEDEKIALKQWEDARKGDVEFDRIARTQADPNLASACGLVAPVGRYTDAENDTVEKVLFSLKVGEISQLFQVPAGLMCVKCVAIIPPDSSVPPEKVRATLEREIYEKKLSAEIPKFFADVKKAAQPNVFLKGPPSSKELEDAVRDILQTGAANPAGTAPMPKP